MMKAGQGKGFLNLILLVLFVLGLVGETHPQVPGVRSVQDTSGGNPAADRINSEISDYVVGEGDVLRINVWKEPEVSQTVIVRPDGKVSLPLINDVPVSGMTPSAIQVMLTTRLEPFIRNPKVTVSVMEIRSKLVYIMGQVARPGSVPILTPMTVMQLLANAGGFTPFANRKNITVIRRENGRELRFRFNYEDVVRGRRPEQNLALRAGDTVVVP